MPLQPLLPFDATNRLRAAIPFAFEDYLDLVETTGRSLHPAEPATPESDQPLTGKGRKRKKLLVEQAQEPMAEDIPESTPPESDALDGLDATDPSDGPTDTPIVDACEADHAPTAHP